MGYKYCSNRHVYDPELSTCPYCHNQAETSMDSTNSIKKTERINFYQGSFLESQAVNNSRFVTGWLVVIDGYGYGSDLPISHGLNSIGRLTGDIVINFGDETISREKHAFLAYDQEENIFIISLGEGRNLLKVNKCLVMSSQKLEIYDQIQLGATTLLFIPFCNEFFNWQFLKKE